MKLADLNTLRILSISIREKRVKTLPSAVTFDLERRLLASGLSFFFFTFFFIPSLFREDSGVCVALEVAGLPGLLTLGASALFFKRGFTIE